MVIGLNVFLEVKDMRHRFLPQFYFKDLTFKIFFLNLCSFQYNLYRNFFKKCSVTTMCEHYSIGMYTTNHQAILLEVFIVWL